MQNRFTGDIGDFGKLGLLRALQTTGLSIGVNWYLAPDESHNNDGRFVQYLEDEAFRECDPALWSGLKQIVSSGRRTVSALEDAHLLDAVFFSDVLSSSGTRAERTTMRKEWHQRGVLPHKSVF